MEPRVLKKKKVEAVYANNVISGFICFLFIGAHLVMEFSLVITIFSDIAQGFPLD